MALKIRSDIAIQSGMLGIFSSNSFLLSFFVPSTNQKIPSANANINFIHSFPPPLPHSPFLNSNKERNIGHTCTLIYTEAAARPTSRPMLRLPVHCSVHFCQTTLANLTIFGGFAKYLLARLSATSSGEGSHPDAVVCESVEAVQLQHLAFGLFGLELAVRLCM